MTEVAKTARLLTARAAYGKAPALMRGGRLISASRVTIKCGIS